MKIEISPDADVLATDVAARIVERLAEIQSLSRTPSIVLTGGTIAIAIYEQLPAEGVDWTDVDFYWGDERFVPEGHADRNDQQARDSFLTRLEVPEANIHTVAGHDCSLSAREAAEAYAAELPTTPFDLVLLGMGPDGHVASLFPGFEQLHEVERRAIEVFDSPKPPPVRITLTFPALNDAQAVWFLVSGAGKAEAVARAHGAGTVEDTPATGGSGVTQTMWFLDEAAASQL